MRRDEQSDRNADRKIGIQIGPADRLMQRRREMQTGKHADGQAYRQKDRHTDRAGMLTERQTDAEKKRDM